MLVRALFHSEKSAYIFARARLLDSYLLYQKQICLNLFLSIFLHFLFCSPFTFYVDMYVNFTFFKKKLFMLSDGYICVGGRKGKNRNDELNKSVFRSIENVHKLRKKNVVSLSNTQNI